MNEYPPPRPRDDSNVLARIRGDDVADVLSSLAPCGSSRTLRAAFFPYPVVSGPCVS